MVSSAESYVEQKVEDGSQDMKKWRGPQKLVSRHNVAASSHGESHV